MGIRGVPSRAARSFAILIPLCGAAWADTAAFDLAGPSVDVTVTRSGHTLPVARVPNLLPGDRLWIHPALPAGESVHYLLIAAFLRGSTNPPPDDWFTRAETWQKQVRTEGIGITVPPGAEQALLFLAPETVGDFKTLRSAVQGRPGAFVRVAQDLNQASLDRTRLDEYLATVKETSEKEPAELHDRSVLLARSLGIKLDEHCFDKTTEQQAPCLTKDMDQMVLNDGHAESMVAALTSGPASDLISQLTVTPQAGYGYYSPYVGAVLDVLRLMDNFRTANYQYIPALALPQQDELRLRLNTPPSFHKPKSVLVAALPAVHATEFPRVRPVDAKEIACAGKSSALLPVEGAPLVFSTGYGQNFTMRVQTAAGTTADLPALADAARGGFVVDTRTLSAVGSDITGVLRGQWGFDQWTGPAFRVHVARTPAWSIPGADESALVVGREDTIHLESPDAVCVDKITVNEQGGDELKTAWKRLTPDRIELKIGLQDQKPGPLVAELKQTEDARTDKVHLNAYAEAGHLDRFLIAAGDNEGLLEGTRLDEVTGLRLKGARFVPGEVTRDGQKDELWLTAPDGVAVGASEKLSAQVTLKDGRVLDLAATTGPPRPKVALVSRNVRAEQSAAIRLASADELPQNGRLVFFVRSERPEAFPRDEKIEVAGPDNSFHATLSVSGGQVILQDAQTAMATLDPLKSFGPSAFGALRFRPVSAEGARGEWQPLATLVRLPTLTEVRCPESPDKPCTLSGTDLFLIDSVSADLQFTQPVMVPEGFADSKMSVPRPTGTLLYLKLRDNPAAVNVAALPVLPE